MALDLTTLNYSEDTFSLNEDSGQPLSFFFKPDGLKMYVTDGSPDRVRTYDLSPAWDVSSATIDGTEELDIAGSAPYPVGIFISPSGLKMIIACGSGQEINGYTLSVAWDVSSASHDGLFEIWGEIGAPAAIYVDPSGGYVFIADGSGDTIDRYTMSTAWDVTSAGSHQDLDVDTVASGGEPNSFFFDADGSTLYVCRGDGQDIVAWDLGTAWDLTTAVEDDTNIFDVSSEEAGNVVCMMATTTVLIIQGTTSEDIYKYNFVVPAVYTGTVQEESVNVARTVRIYQRDTGELIQEVTSNATSGAFSFNLIEQGKEYYIVALDDDAGDDYNNIIYDRVVGV